MANYSIQSANTDLEGVLHGTTTNQIEGLFALYNRAGRQLLIDIDPQETKRTTQFSSPIFNGVNQYALAEDVKGNRLIDIRPQVQRTPRDVWSQQYASIRSNKHHISCNSRSGPRVETASGSMIFVYWALHIVVLYNMFCRSHCPSS